MTEINSIFKKQFSFFFNANRQTKLLTGFFFVFLALSEIFVFQTGFPVFFKHLIENQDYIYAVFCIFHLAAALYFSFVFFLIAFSSKRSYTAVYFLIFTISCLFQYGYQKALGKFTDIGDVIIAFSATDAQKFDSILSFFNYGALIPCIIFVLIASKIEKSERRFGGKALLLTLVCFGSFNFYLSYVNRQFIGHRFPNLSFGAFSQTVADYAQRQTIFYVSPPSREVVEKPDLPENYTPQNNIIFVFDETIRGDHLSLNGYKRPTTPYLEELAKTNLLKNWGIAAAGSTASQPSYNAVITGITPDQLAESPLNNNSRPSIFQYAKAMNYKTYFFDGQKNEFWGGIPDDENYVDNFIPLKDLDDKIIGEDEHNKKISHEVINDGRLQLWEADQRMAEKINEIFSSSTGNFVFVYKRGSHFPYEKNFPAEEAVWTPVYLFSENYEIPPAEKLDEVVNSYDNSLRYNLEGFFKSLVPDQSALPNNTVIVYTGDHGESLFVNQRAAHGSITREEAIVPLFVLGNLPHQPDVKFKASHSNIFPTLLDLMNYPEDLRKQKYAVSLLKATANDSSPRFYNAAANQMFPFD